MPPGRPVSADKSFGDGPVSDLIVLLLGTGGILLMAAYATLCDRV